MRYPTPRRSISRNYHIKGSNKLLYFARLVQRKANLEFSANNFPVKYARIHQEYRKKGEQAQLLRGRIRDPNLSFPGPFFRLTLCRLSFFPFPPLPFSCLVNLDPGSAWKGMGRKRVQEPGKRQQDPRLKYYEDIIRYRCVVYPYRRSASNV